MYGLVVIPLLRAASYISATTWSMIVINPTRFSDSGYGVTGRFFSLASFRHSAVGSSKSNHTVTDVSGREETRELIPEVFDTQSLICLVQNYRSLQLSTSHEDCGYFCALMGTLLSNCDLCRQATGIPKTNRNP